MLGAAARTHQGHQIHMTVPIEVEMAKIAAVLDMGTHALTDVVKGNGKCQWIGCRENKASALSASD